MFVLACALAAALLPAAFAQDQYTLKYAPKTGTTISYEGSVQGELVVPMVGGPVPFTGDMAYDVAPESIDDKGTVTEKITYTAAAAQAMGMPLTSQYIGKAVSVKREPDGAWSLGGESLPPPDLMSADFFVMFAQLPRFARFSPNAVKVGDQWTIEKQPLPPLFSQPKPEGEQPAEGEKTSKTFVEQRCTLTAVKDYEGRKAAIIMCELKVTMEQEEIIPGMPVDAELAAQMELAVYTDTGELIVSDVKLDKSWLRVEMNGAPIEITLQNIKGRFKVKGAGEAGEQPQQLPGGNGNKRPGT
jgi:hypothetical protein